ncbi:NADPH-dependent FMN reductase [Flavihumibacter stibioxidans]|uniref:Flavoprotein n=1 Tax=Flavihumibacter stibioxidans TaxID=1834163 RepID=A0ABR7M6I4_9BACT|nr:NADPH-dependent FMN reductase [Flavihumibacter stibioxidans]MBC6490526.1 flavoprotein [Flavihumibacter stibioxidans]
MHSKKKILAIPGTVKENSTHKSFIRAMADLSKDSLDIELYDGLGGLPPFNPDIEDANASGSVAAFRNKLKAADGIIICTPEYAHGVPGVLKNAIDWTVGSGEFYQKPTLLVTASTDGRFGHQAMLEILRVIATKRIDELQLLVPFIKTKINSGGIITDETTLLALKEVLAKYLVVLNEVSLKS